jgi:hypothetical protein
MRNGRFDTSKCREKLEKWVYYAPILPKCQEVPQHSKQKNSKTQKIVPQQ